MLAAPYFTEARSPDALWQVYRRQYSLRYFVRFFGEMIGEIYRSHDPRALLGKSILRTRRERHDQAGISALAEFRSRRER